MQNYQVRYEGMLLGDGTVYGISNITGLGLAPKRSRVYEVPGADGVVFGREFRNGRTLTFEGDIHCDTAEEAWSAVLALEAVWDARDVRVKPRTVRTLFIKFPGQPERWVIGRPNQFDYNPVNSGAGHIMWSATFDSVTAEVYGS